MNNDAALSPSDLRQLQNYEAMYDRGKGLLKYNKQQSAVAQHSLPYALLLLRRNNQADHQRAITIITAVLDHQLHEPDWERGRFPFLFPETWRDLNANLFMTPYLVAIHTHWRDKLPAPLANRFEKALYESVNIVERRWADELFDIHRDFVAYTNIFILYIRALYMLGSTLKIPRLTRDARAQWQRWFNHTSLYGIDEFTSPSYSEVVYEGLLDIRELVKNDPTIYKEVTLILDHLCTLQHALNHPLMRIEAVGVSRDYRLFVPPGQGAFAFLEHKTTQGYTPPEHVIQSFKNRQFPYRVAGRAGTNPFRFQSWQDRTAAMGSMTGGNYFPQQIHLLAAVGESPENRACAYFNAMPDNPIQGYVRQHDHRALCLYARTPTTYHRYQLRKSPEKNRPLKGTFPPCLGLTQAWEKQNSQPGIFTAAAYGYTLRVLCLTLQNDRLTPITLKKDHDKLDVGKGNHVTGWWGDPDALWSVFLVELLPAAQLLKPVTLKGKVADTHISLEESGGLNLSLHRRPNGELVELYDEDWRTLPLLQTPTHTLHAGDLIAAAVYDQLT